MLILKDKPQRYGEQRNIQNISQVFPAAEPIRHLFISHNISLIFLAEIWVIACSVTFRHHYAQVFSPKRLGQPGVVFGPPPKRAPCETTLREIALTIRRRSRTQYRLTAISSINLILNHQNLCINESLWYVIML